MTKPAKPRKVIQIDDDAPSTDVVDDIREALVELNAPLRRRDGQLYWRVGEQLILMNTTRLVYETGKIGIRFERCNAKGRYEPVAAPKQILRMFLSLAEQGQWWVEAWDAEDETE